MVKKRIPQRKTAVPSRRGAAKRRDTQTEARILDAAHTVFVRRGTAGARMQEIANEAGVNKALLHYYFRNKDRLSQAVFQRVAAALFSRIAMVLTSEGELEDKVRGLIAAYLDQLSRTPFVPGYVLSELNLHPDRAGQFLELISRATGASPSGIIGLLQRQIDARVRAGSMRAIEADQFFTNLVSLCVFPFAAKPLLCAVLQMDDRGFADYIERRRTALPQFYLDALRP
jgi:TetR/AcrR family transcriptional regulator